MNTKTKGKTPKPQSVDEALKKLDEVAEGEDATPTVESKQAEPEETAEDLLSTEAEGEPSALEQAAEEEHDPDAIPPWVCFPESPKWKIPEHKTLMILRFRAKWTDTPHLGDRVCILWSLSATEEKLSSKRTRGDGAQVLSEMSKGIIRAFGMLPLEAEGNNQYKSTVPMHIADWTGTLGSGNVDRFWNEIGAKCRTMISNAYLRTHSLNAEETADFFLNCFVVRSAVGG